MFPLLTPRLEIRRFSLDDASFVRELLNEPLFLLHIGDRGVRTLADARDYLRDGPLASYATHGFGLYRVGLRADDTPLGMCGLLKRDRLADVDIGFAFLARHHGAGYALEAARAVLEHAHDDLGLRRVVAITSPGNERSKLLLQKLGLRQNGTCVLRDDDPPVDLFTPD